MHFAKKKSLGQHFLNSDYVPERMCTAGDIRPGDTVLEIGPGTGALTKVLLAHGATVIALETDPRALEVLRETFAAALDTGQLTLIKADARALDPAKYGLGPHTYKVVANVPYYLSGQLLRRVLDTTHQPTTLVFLLQKELVERIARAKKSSLLSISVAVFGTPHYVTTVKRTHFSPPPKVDSAILLVDEITDTRLPPGERAAFFNLLQHGFGQKRKQLQGNLNALYPRPVLQAAFATLGLTDTIRAEDLSVADWLQLHFHLQSTASSPASP